MSGTTLDAIAARRRRHRAARPPRATDAQALAQGLGWFSIALGAVELLAPHAVARPLGLAGRERLVAAYGIREIAAGVGLLTARDKTPWLWGRVAGDALDLATLAAGLAGRSPRKRGNAGLAMLAVAGVTALDVLCALATAREDAARARANTARRFDYGGRRGFPRPSAEMRGAARDFEVPRDFRTPELLRPWADGHPPAAAATTPVKAA
jgi:hypothetical protein